jgi:hypothetical protein
MNVCNLYIQMYLISNKKIGNFQSKVASMVVYYPLDVGIHVVICACCSKTS